MTADEALRAIRGLWARWALNEVDAVHAWAAVAIILERAGYPPIGSLDYLANDDGAD